MPGGQHLQLRVWNVPRGRLRGLDVSDYDDSVLGRLGFIGVAQAAGFKLPEIKELVTQIDAGSGMSTSMRSLSVRKLGEIESSSPEPRP